MTDLLKWLSFCSENGQILDQRGAVVKVGTSVIKEGTTQLQRYPPMVLDILMTTLYDLLYENYDSIR